MNALPTFNIFWVASEMSRKSR